MSYFSRRNEYVVEYSGHEVASEALRERIIAIVGKYVGHNRDYGDSAWFVETDRFDHEVKREFPGKNFRSLLASGEFHEVFTIVEIFLDMAKRLETSRRNESFVEVLKAFMLSGSVYCIGQDSRVELKLDKDQVEKIDSLKPILEPYPEFQQRFFQAVGNLVGRRAKPEDVVKDLYVAAEGYLKAKTGSSRFGDAIVELSKRSLINKEQKKVLVALQEFRSDADGAGHAGNSDTPTEETALWFLDTLIAQLRMIDKQLQK